LIQKSKKGEYKAIFNVSVLTTGTNIPVIDCITWLRPTASPVLWLQACGRGARLYPNKKDCLILDLVGNMERFRSIENPVFESTSGFKKQEFQPEELIAMGIDPSQMKGKTPTKDCPKCAALIASAARKCDSCGHLFISLKSAYNMQNAEKNTTHDVDKCGYQPSLTAAGEPCMIVTYVTCEGAKFKEWILHQRNFNRARWHGLKEAIDLEIVRKITLIPTKNPKFPRIEIECQS
jgi:superfamily II DNA or RNA helicase